MKTREIDRVIPSLTTTDGAGVRIQRSLGANPMVRHDPFLLLDEFYSDDPDDYIAGFPSHPHRGFETVTYMLDGHMRHEDHLGNQGDLGPGDVQWMTAARGIIHSEMPRQSEGRMRGFQLWINLPAREKMKSAHYQDIPAARIPVVEGSGYRVKVIAGTYRNYGDDERETPGPVQHVTTAPHYLDVVLEPGANFRTTLPRSHNALIYLYEGTAAVGGRSVPSRAAALLGDGEDVRIVAGEDGASLILLAAQPLNEPVVQYGPFVMNTREEIEQALRDYRDGKLTAA